MASIFNLLSIILFLGLLFQGDADCSPYEPQGLDIVQSKTGNLVKGVTEWKVIITNSCRCSQSQVKLYCNGFQTNKAVDTSILRKSGDVCILNNDNVIYPSQSLQFLYAWNTQYPFVLASSTVQCNS